MFVSRLKAIVVALSCCGSTVSVAGVYCQCFVYGVVFFCVRGEQQQLCSSGPGLCERAQRGVRERETQDWKVLWERGDLAGLPPVCHLIYMHWHVQTPRATGGRPIIPSARLGLSEWPASSTMCYPGAFSEHSGKFWKERAVTWEEFLVDAFVKHCMVH